MKKLIGGFTMGIFLLVASVVLAVSPDWQLDAGATVYTLTNTCVLGPCAGGPYPHTMDVLTFNPDGTFTATGFWNDDLSYTWTMTGEITDSTIAYTLTYTGTGAGFVITATGSIDGSGAMTGTSTGSNGENMTWTITPNATAIVPSLLPSECPGVEGDYNVIQGTSGDDNLKGTSKRDLILAKGGKDKVEGGSNNDCIVGGGGDDIINGGSGDDVILAEGGEDAVDGGSGNDNIYGGNAKDTLNGGSGNDNVWGESNDDVLNGGSGKDDLDGGAGSSDIANGGSGQDTCSAVETESSCEL